MAQQAGAMGAVRQSVAARQRRAVVHAGWLKKRGDVRKNWKRRWFELTTDFTLRSGSLSLLASLFPCLWAHTLPLYRSSAGRSAGAAGAALLVLVLR